MTTEQRTPRRGDHVIVFGERGLIVHIEHGVAHIDADDAGLRVHVAEDRLSWDIVRMAWRILIEDAEAA